MYYTDDPARDFARYDAAQAKAEEPIIIILVPGESVSIPATKRICVRSG